MNGLEPRAPRLLGSVVFRVSEAQGLGFGDHEARTYQRPRQRTKRLGCTNPSETLTHFLRSKPRPHRRVVAMLDSHCPAMSISYKTHTQNVSLGGFVQVLQPLFGYFVVRRGQQYGTFGTRECSDLHSESSVDLKP